MHAFSSVRNSDLFPSLSLSLRAIDNFVTSPQLKRQTIGIFESRVVEVTYANSNPCCDCVRRDSLQSLARRSSGRRSNRSPFPWDHSHHTSRDVATKYPNAYRTD